MVDILNQNRTPKPVPNINLAKGILCQKCGGEVFIPAYYLKTLSAIASGTGKVMNMHFHVWVCLNCHKPVELPK